ncbi:MAG: PDZ domain-containing protein [Deltaproteobacteria bacterium]|nr:MAG: PDZ domain-containing protein [Deltaproteobacteria bacterium]
MGLRTLLTSLALLGLAAVVSISGAVLASSERLVDDERTASLTPSITKSVGFSARYDLRKLSLLHATLGEIDNRYVDLGRVDFDTMFEAALQATERLVPTTLFQRVEGSSLLHARVGYHHTVLEIPPIGSRQELQAALAQVATLIAAHVDPSDIPVDDDREPWPEVEYAMINGMLSTLDPHSRLLPPEDSREMDVENSGEFGGLGITIVQRQGQLTIDYPLPDTPASEAGLQADDRIVRIDGESTINMSLQEAVGRLRGPVGSAVQLVIERDAELEPLSVRLVRARIKINPVEGELLDGGVGIVTIKSFHANVSSDLDAVLSKLARQAPGGRLNGLVLDLRGNPGGYLSQSVAVANKFLEDGIIVRTMGRGRTDETERARATRTQPRYPIAVLIDPSSASASEIVAGALRNNDRAITLGERSFGKGSVQNLESFFDGSKLKLTIAQYYTPPGDQSIQSIGIPADIEIVHTVAQSGAEEGRKIALVHYRERVRREADYERGLARELEIIDPPTYGVRMLRPATLRRRGPTLDHLREDPQVELARQILLQGQGSVRRSDLLERAAPVVERTRRQAELEIIDAFRELGIDWSAGASVTKADLEVNLDLGSDRQLVAGQEETVWLEVTNRGPEPIHRLVAVSTSDSEILNGREFVFGRVEPGQTVRFPQHISLNEGYPTEKTPVRFSFRDIGGDVVASWGAHLPVVGRELPRLAWQWELVDRGDGDGRPSPGEQVAILLTVENLGLGPTSDAFARLRNRSGQALDLVQGTLEVGDLRLPDGSACPIVDAGPASDDEVDASPPISPADLDEPATEEPDCSRTLLPGETWTGELLVEVRRPGELALELSVGDARAYDHAAVMRSNFHRTFTNKDTIRFATGRVFPIGQRMVPPDIEISRAPGPKSRRAAVSISGRVTDDRGLSHVVVYHDDRKVFFADGGQGLQALPFTADVELKDGLNTLVVIATDESGLTRTSSVVTSFHPPSEVAGTDAAVSTP